MCHTTQAILQFIQGCQILFKLWFGFGWDVVLTGSLAFRVFPSFVRPWLIYHSLQGKGKCLILLTGIHAYHIFDLHRYCPCLCHQHSFCQEGSSFFPLSLTGKQHPLAWFSANPIPKTWVPRGVHSGTCTIVEIFPICICRSSELPRNLGFNDCNIKEPDFEAVSGKS
jgi:hypothetical protein